MDETVTVPDVRGLDGAEARDRLQEMGFYVIGHEAINGKTVVMASLWQVVGQSPAPGERVPISQPITLKVNRFKPTPKPTPTQHVQHDENRDTFRQVKPTRKPDPEPKPETDPRHGTCAEANAHGLGPYVRGIDPEYDWYQDRDGDGRVCEPR